MSTGTTPFASIFWRTRSLSMEELTVKRRWVLVPVATSPSITKYSEGGSTSMLARAPGFSAGRRYTPTVFQLSERAPVGAR